MVVNKLKAWRTVIGYMREDGIQDLADHVEVLGTFRALAKTLIDAGIEWPTEEDQAKYQAGDQLDALRHRCPPEDITPQALWERIRVLQGMVDVPMEEKLTVLRATTSAAVDKARAAEKEAERLRDQYEPLSDDEQELKENNDGSNA